MATYGETLKPGDEAIFYTPSLDGFWSKWAHDNNGKKVKVTKRVEGFGGGWYVEGHELWIQDEHLKPIDDEEKTSSSSTSAHTTDQSEYCGCKSPNLVTNTANGNEFQFCRTCRKERS